MTVPNQPDTQPDDPSDAHADANPGGYDGPPLQFVENCMIPPRYEVWADGVYRQRTKKERADAIVDDDTEDNHLREHAESASLDCAPTRHTKPPQHWRRELRRLTATPMWVRRFARRVDTNEVLVELGTIHMQTRQDHYMWVPYEHLVDRKKLQELTKHGLQMSAGRAVDVEEYLYSVCAGNMHRLSWLRLSARIGGYPVHDDDGNYRGHGYLLSDRWIGPPNSDVLFDERERRQYNTYYRPSGDEAAWFAKFHEIWDTGVVSRAIIGASFASPMLELIDARNMIVHLWSHSGGGKTAIMLFAASIWGDPDQNKNSFNSTQTARTEQFRHRTSFPAVFDELQSATDKELATTLYSLELGRGRMRANRVGGGVEDSTNEWKLSILTNGEESIVGRGIADLGGQRNRVLEINKGALPTDAARRLHQWFAERHYGWGGIRFLEALSAHTQDADEREALKTRFEYFRRTIGSEYPDLIARDMHIAAIMTALYCVRRHPAFIGMDQTAARAKTLEDGHALAKIVLDEDPDTTTPGERALMAIQSDFHAHRHAWVDIDNEADRELFVSGNRRGMLTGVKARGRGEVYLIPTAAHSLIEREGLPFRRVFSDWKRAGIVTVGKDRKRTKRRVMDKWSAKVYALNYAAVFGTDTDTED